MHEDNSVTIEIFNILHL